MGIGWIGLMISCIGVRIGLIELGIGLIELGLDLIKLGIGMIELRIHLIELGQDLIELGIGLMELVIGLRINNARRAVLARVSGLVNNVIIFFTAPAQIALVTSNTALAIPHMTVAACPPCLNAFCIFIFIFRHATL